MKKIAGSVSLLLTALLLTAALGGCQGGKPPETSETPSESSPPALVEGGEIVVGIAQDLDDSLDPQNMAAAGTREVLFNVFEGLVKPTADGNLIPAVASGYTVSETGDAFTFTLRDGVRFHNGETVTVGDIVYSISRCAGLLGGEPIVPAFSAVESVEAADDKTVVITLTAPDIEFIAYLTVPIIPEGYNDHAARPIGTGPFKFVSRSPQENYIIERFDDYWGEKAHLEKITFKIIENADTILMSLKSGAIDFCAHLTSSQVSELGGSFVTYTGNMNLVQAVYLNNAVAPLDNEDVRRALSYAINREEIFSFLNLLPGETETTRGFPLGSNIYPAFKKYFVPELAEYYPYNPEQCKELLAEAGYPEGFDLEIVVPSNYQPHIDTAQIVAEQLNAAGVRATIRLVEWATWRSDVYNDRQFQATIVGLDASTLTAKAMLERFESTHSKNFINFSDEEYDEVFAEAAAAASDEKQVGLYKRLQEILTERAANLYIQDLMDLVAMRKDLVGFTPYPLYVIDFSVIQYISVE